MTELQADCSRCFGLCCVSLTLTRSADFAIDKPAGVPCPNLTGDLRCGIHATLRPGGFAGCSTYDCFGAGQRISQLTFGGQGWRETPDSAPAMFSAFGVLRQLHELLFYLDDCHSRELNVALARRVAALRANVEAAASGTGAELAAIDAAAIRAEVAPVLSEVSAEVRACLRGRELAGADLLGKSFAGADLRGAHLRGTLLIGADLSEADLRHADLLGTDLRDVQLDGADLRGALFVTQQQLNSARGDRRTSLPAAVHRPSHWS